MPWFLRHSKNQQAVLACFVFLVSCLITARAYSALLNQDRAYVNKLLLIHLGEQGYNINSQGHCSGYLQAQLKEDNGFQYRLNGKLSTLWNSRIEPLSLKADFLFNPLGQLNSGLLDLSFSEIRLHTQLSEVNPVKLDMTLTVSDKHYAQTISIPGPFTLKALPTAGEYALQGNLSQKSAPLIGLPILNELRERLQIKLIENNPATDSCQETSLTPLDLSLISRQALELYRQIGILPGNP